MNEINRKEAEIRLKLDLGSASVYEYVSSPSKVSGVQFDVFRNGNNIKILLGTKILIVLAFSSFN